jgi:hypothetical protein
MNKKLLLRLLVAISSVAVCVSQTRGPSVERLVSAAEFREAGLHKLSPDELAALNRWLGRYAAAVAVTVGQVSNPKTSPKPDVIESRIEGDFEGWDGETIFKLDNGQIWQQASYAYRYHYAYRPEVVIYRSGGGYRMRVEDVSDTIPVKRLK